MGLFDIIRKMIPRRQVEAAQLLVSANNYSTSYAAAILAATPEVQLVNPSMPRRTKGITPEALGRMEDELANLQQAISSIQENYSQDHLHLTVIKGYLAKLVQNAKVVRYLEKRQPDLLSEFRKIVEMTST